MCVRACVCFTRDNVDWGVEQEEEAKEKVKENSADLMDPDKAGELCQREVCICQQHCIISNALYCT